MKQTQSPLDLALRHLRPDTLHRAAWVGVWGTLLLTAALQVYLVVLELDHWRDRAFQVDELYFASCAARGSATHAVMAGCHDNKAPLIFLLYQAVQKGDGPYNVFAVKIAALATVALIVALVAVLARRLAGPLAAVVAASLFLQAISLDTSVMAFKTDTVGGALVLLALVLLVGSDDRRLQRWWWAGVLIGLATLSKQTFAVIAVAVVLWARWSGADIAMPTSWPRVLRAGVFLLGVLAPFIVFLIGFTLTGREVDYLASFFIYPSIYGGVNSDVSPRHLSWRLADVLDTMADSTLLVLLFVGAALLLAADREYRRSPVGTRRLLVLLVSLVLLILLVVSPYHFVYHAVPAWAMMAILAGVLVADIWPRSEAPDFRLAACLGVALLVSTVLSAGTAWSTNGGRGSAIEVPRSTAASFGLSKAGFAYVLGTWPDFYVYNDLVPASDVMFPWALPGVPTNWAFTTPPSDSWRARALRYLHARNTEKLFQDFSRTPPEYIVVLDAMARHPGSSQVADVPGFDRYLLDHCTFQQAKTDERRGVAKVYRCNGSAG